MPDRGTGFVLIVEVDLAVLSGVVEHVLLPVTADGAYRDRQGSLTLEDGAVVTAMQVEPHIARFVGRERAVDVGWGTRRARCLAEHLHPHMLAVDPDHRGAVGVVGGMEIHLAGEEPVVPNCFMRQSVATLHQGRAQRRAVDRQICRGHEGHGRIDHRVREKRDEFRRHRIPGGPGERGEKAAVEVAAAPGCAFGEAVLRSELEQVWIGLPGDPRKQAVEQNERLVAIAGDRHPAEAVAFPHLGPAPLVGMAVPVAKEDIQQPRAEELLRVHLVARLLLGALDDVDGACDLERARKGPRRVIVLVRPLFDEAECAGKRSAELTQSRVVGEVDELRNAVQDAGGIRERGDHDRGRRMEGADLVLRDFRGDRRLEVGRHPPGGVLVDRPEGVL